jgi:ribonuclease-3
MPSYAIEEEGPDHAKRFTATVSVAGRSFGKGQGRSKKEAEQNAAQEAFETLAASQMVAGSGSGGNGKAGTGEAGTGKADTGKAGTGKAGTGKAGTGTAGAVPADKPAGRK